MSTTGPHTHSQTIRRHSFYVVLSAALLLLAAPSLDAQAANWEPDDYRIGAGIDKFDGVSQFAVAYRLRPSLHLRSSHIELAVGVIESSSETRAFVSLGPVWRFPVGRSSNSFIDLGFSPTLVTGSSFDGRDLGGDIHFTSSASIGARFGTYRQLAVSLRTQHTSNSGMNSANPGLDMIGLNFSYEFGARI